MFREFDCNVIRLRGSNWQSDGVDLAQASSNAFEEQVTGSLQNKPARAALISPQAPNVEVSNIH